MTDCFIDTNILIYRTFADGQFYQLAKDKLKVLAETRRLYISEQIIFEYINVTTNKGVFKDQALTMYQAINNIDLYLSLINLADKAPSYQEIRELLLTKDIDRKKLFDSKIYLTMKANNINTILTANKKDFEIFTGIEIIEL